MLTLKKMNDVSMLCWFSSKYGGGGHFCQLVVFFWWNCGRLRATLNFLVVVFCKDRHSLGVFLPDVIWNKKFPK